MPTRLNRFSIEMPVMMPGSVIGNSSSRRNTVLPGKRSRSRAMAAGTPTSSVRQVAPVAT